MFDLGNGVSVLRTVSQCKVGLSEDILNVFSLWKAESGGLQRTAYEIVMFSNDNNM